MRSGGHQEKLSPRDAIATKEPRHGAIQAHGQQGPEGGAPWSGWLTSTLRRDSACSRNLNWRFDLASEMDPEVVGGMLEDDGWRLRCRHATLRVFRHAKGHELAWALNTGRVQLRVDLGVPPDRRPDIAKELFRNLGVLLAGLQDRSVVAGRVVVA